MSDVAVVHLGRQRARGEVRRVESWCSVFRAAGATVETVPVPRTRLPAASALGDTIRGRAVPEVLAWSLPELQARIDAVDPKVVVVVSPRAYRAGLEAGHRSVVLDVVDRLDRSYADRAELVPPLRGAGYRGLALLHSRVLRHPPHPSVRMVAAGWRDAQDLGAEWVPIVVQAPASATSPEPVPPPARDHDCCFVGTLRYPPNVEALDRLARCWPALLRERPGLRMLVAGAAPTARVRALCARHAWTLLADFPDVAEIMARAHVAVAPLVHTAGMQIKVLDAAAAGMPQVVTAPALEGFAPGFPIEPCPDDDAFVAAVAADLAHPDQARDRAASVRDAVLADYGVERWTAWAATLL